EEAEGGEHEDADARAEVSAIDGHGELKQHRDPHAPLMHGCLATKSRKSSKRPLCQKQNGREQDEKRDELYKSAVACASEQQTPKPAARRTDQSKPREPRPDRPKMLTETEDASSGANDERNGAGCVRHNRRSLKKK